MKRYWENKGKYQDLYDKLSKLIPAEGEVANPKDNPALENLRVASNCYYDLFNNGLCNRASEFRKVFGFAGTWIAKERFPYHAPLEKKLDLFILEADKEQVYNNPKCRAGEELYEALKGLAPCQRPVPGGITPFEWAVSEKAMVAVREALAKAEKV